MKKTIMLLLALLMLAAAAFAYEVKCAYHDYAICYSTGQTQFSGTHMFTKYHCTCGDDVWVRNY